MYKSVFYDKSEEMLHVWDDKRGHICQKFKNFAFVPTEFGKYQTLNGKRVDKVYRFDYTDSNAYESDLPVETKALIELYGETDEPAEGIKTLIIDIETDITGGYPSMDTFDKEITAFACYDKSIDQYKCFILDKDFRITDYKKDNVEVVSCSTEESLLSKILTLFEEIRPDIVTGWNCAFSGLNQGFDIPYIYGRISRVLGKYEASRLSEINNVYVRKRDKTVAIAGVNCIDYMFLYEKFRFEPRQNYRLDFIANLELGKGKIKYDGSLNQLYKDDIHKYIEYNLCDVRLVKELDDKFKFLDLAITVCSAGHVPYEWYHMSSRFIEGAIITYMRNNGKMVAPNKPVDVETDVIDEGDEDEDDSFTGAYVKTPVPGLYSWVFSADINSLYPSTIRTLNISPETYISKIENWNVDEYIKGNLKEVSIAGTSYTIEEFKKFIEDENISVSSIGAMYNCNKPGIIPTILELWFSQRLIFQEKVQAHIKDGNKEMEAYYSRRQHCQKIFLNSVYGILGLASSRFYSKDNAESTTISGQTIIKTSEKIVIDYFKKQYAKFGKTIEDTTNIVQYVDTDSLYISVDTLADLNEIKEENRCEFTKQICVETVELINNMYPILVKRFFNSSNNKIKIAADTINQTAFWKKKKAYALNKVYDMGKGKSLNNKIEIKGLSSVRSDFPIKFKDFLEKFLKDVLFKVDVKQIDGELLHLRENLNSCSIQELAKNTSVKFISEKQNKNFDKNSRQAFTTGLGATAQCKAALMYNDLLTKFNLDNKVEPIYHGQKIKYLYLKNNPYGIEALAFKGDGTDPREILDIIEMYCDKTKMYTSVLENKLRDFYDILKWEYPSLETKKASEFFGF